MYNGTQPMARSLRKGKIGLIIALACMVVCAQAVALAVEQTHHHTPEHCCQLCHLAPMTFVQPAASMAVEPVLARSWLDRNGAQGVPRQADLGTDSSRAPPA